MLRILAYHRVAEVRDTPALDSRSVSATPEGFAQQMEHLARSYRVVSMPDVLQAIEKGRPLPKRAVLITFDDAYRDFAEIAWPIVKKFHLSATMFVPTAFPGHEERVFWSDALYQAFAATSRMEINIPPLGRLPLLPPDQKRKSLRVVQNHLTITPHFEAMRLVDLLCAELGLSRAREIGACLPVFCYPNGNHNDGAVSVLREHGIRLAFTTLSGPNELGSVDLLRLHRTMIMPRTTPAIFRLRLLRLGIHMDAFRDRKQREVMTSALPDERTNQV